MNVRAVFSFLYIELFSLKQNFLNIVKDFSAYELIRMPSTEQYQRPLQSTESLELDVLL